MKTKFAEAKSIVIVPDEKIDLDLIAASISLGLTLKDASKKVSILLNDNIYPTFLANIISPYGLKFIEPNKPNDYIISLKDQNVLVEEVRWEQKGDQINIVITTKKGEINTNKASIQKIGYKPDLIIVIGRNNLRKKVPEFISQLNQEKFFYINLKGNNQLSIDNQFTLKQTSSLSELIKKFLDNNNLEPTDIVATYLLTGIIWCTNNFQTKTNYSTFQTVLELLDMGASYSIASDKANKNLKLIETKLIIEILKNIKITRDKVAFSKVTTNFVKNIKFDEIIFRNWNLSFYITDVKVSVILIDTKDGTLVYVHSNKPNIIQADKVVSEFEGKGDRHDAYFASTKSINTLENELKLKISVCLTDTAEKERLETKINADFETEVKRASTIEKKQPTRAERKKNTEPLTPANTFPEPIKLYEDTINEPIYNGPLPPAKNK